MKIQTNKNVIYVSDKEAEQIKQMILDGDKFILIDNQLINAAFIEGIFEGEDPNYDSLVACEKRPDKLISAPKQKQDWEGIRETLEEMRRALEEKGIF